MPGTTALISTPSLGPASVGEYADAIVDSMIDGNWGRPARRPQPRPVTCSVCFKRNLRWGNEKGGGWILIEPGSNAPHKCLLPDKEGRLPRPSLL